MGYRIGIDVGGTFTDYLLLGPDGGTREHKVLSTPDDPSRAVLQGLEELATGCALSPLEFLRSVEIIVHGTTVTTNAVLTGRFARTGLLTTHGFRDALQMRRGVRESFYDNKFSAPAPLVPRRLRLPVRGRIGHDGSELEALSHDDVDTAIDALESSEVEAVAICFMHAYANPAHEEAAAERVARRLPAAYLSVSNRVLPQVRFYERTSTTVLNAVVGPILRRYMENLQRRLAQARLHRGISRDAVQRRRRLGRSGGSARRVDPAVGAGGRAECRAGGDRTLRRQPVHHRGHGRHELRRGDGRRRRAVDHHFGFGQPLRNGAAVDGYRHHRRRRRLDRLDRATGCCAWGRRAPAPIRARPATAEAASEPTCSDANLVLGYLSAELLRRRTDPARRAAPRARRSSASPHSRWAWTRCARRTGCTR